MIILSAVISIFLDSFPSARASEKINCIDAIVWAARSTGCEPSVNPVRESGIQTISCGSVPVFVGFNLAAFQKWASDKTANEAAYELVYSLSAPVNSNAQPADHMSIQNDIFCINGDVSWSQVRNLAVTSNAAKQQ